MPLPDGSVLFCERALVSLMPGLETMRPVRKLGRASTATRNSSSVHVSRCIGEKLENATETMAPGATAVSAGKSDLYSYEGEKDSYGRIEKYIHLFFA